MDSNNCPHLKGHFTSFRTWERISNQDDHAQESPWLLSETPFCLQPAFLAAEIMFKNSIHIFDALNPVTSEFVIIVHGTLW